MIVSMDYGADKKKLESFWQDSEYFGDRRTLLLTSKNNLFNSYVER